MIDENLRPHSSGKLPENVRILFGRVSTKQTNQSSQAWQALGVPRKRPCGIFGCFIFSRCEHAATRL